MGLLAWGFFSLQQTQLANEIKGTQATRFARMLLIDLTIVRTLNQRSLRKPHVSDTTPNRAFLRGFPATQFPDFGLCVRSRILVAVFGTLSPHPKIPFPAAVAPIHDWRLLTRQDLILVFDLADIEEVA